MFNFLRRLFGLPSPAPPPADPGEEPPDELNGPQQLKEIEELLDRENENRPPKPPRGIKSPRGSKPPSVTNLDEERWQRSFAPGS
jgi:hypothetical protein